MTRYAAFLLATLGISIGAPCLAEPTVITMPGKGWHLELNVPPSTQLEGESDGTRFRYVGANTGSGFTFSVHLEPMPDGGNAECRDEYWGKARLNPMIVGDSVQEFESEILLGISHRTSGEYQGRAFTTYNAHGYFVHKGACVDLHVSQIGDADDFRTVVESVVSSAKILN